MSFLHRLILTVKKLFHKKIIIGVDVDGVLRDFINQLKKVYHDVYPTYHINKEQNIWSLTDLTHLKEKINYFISEEYPNAIFELANMYSGANTFINKLRKNSNYEIRFVTTQPNTLSKIYTEKWLFSNGFTLDTEEIIYSDKKGSENIDILIDDGIHNLIHAEKNGKLAICFNRPWNIQNKNWNGLRVDAYDDIFSILEQYYKQNKKVQ